MTFRQVSHGRAGWKTNFEATNKCNDFINIINITYIIYIFINIINKVIV